MSSRKSPDLSPYVGSAGRSRTEVTFEAHPVGTTPPAPALHRMVAPSRDVLRDLLEDRSHATMLEGGGRNVKGCGMIR